MYCIFRTIRRTAPPICEGNGGASYSQNVAYLASGVEGGAGVLLLLFCFVFPIFLL